MRAMSQLPMQMTRRTAIRAIGGASAATLALHDSALGMLGKQVAQDAPTRDESPVSGALLAGLEALDSVVIPLMEAHGIPGAQVAIAAGGQLKVARGYGLADVQAQTPMRPETHMVLASVSKVMTAQTILKLVDQGRVQLSDRVFSWFRQLPLAPGMREDPRINEITIQMCLQHTGGWDRKKSGDPSGWSMRIKRALRIDHPPTPLEMIRYMKGVRLDFNPGSEQAYSNFGFVLLGAVIAAVGGQEYGPFVQQHTLQPMGIQGMRRAGVPPDYLPGEARRYMLPAEHQVPGGNSPMVFAAGGWEANCVDMARLLTAIDGSRTGSPWLSPATLRAMVTPAPGIHSAAPDHWFGLGWDTVERESTSTTAPFLIDGKHYTFAKDGSLSGIQTWIEHLADGVNFVLLFNSSAGHDIQAGLGIIRPKVVEFIRGVTQWPQGDLFQQFR